MKQTKTMMTENLIGTTGVLSPRELECLLYAAEGHGAKRTAQYMDISVARVKKLRFEIFYKLRTANITESVTRAYHLHIIQSVESEAPQPQVPHQGWTKGLVSALMLAVIMLSTTHLDDRFIRNRTRLPHRRITTSLRVRGIGYV